MKYWLMRTAIYSADIQQRCVGISWPYERIDPNELLKPGDVAYLAKGHGEIYSWGYVSKTEPYQDVNLEKEMLRVSVIRPVLRDEIIPAEKLRESPNLAKLFVNTETNLIELPTDDAKVLNHLLRAQGVEAPSDPSEEEVKTIRIASTAQTPIDELIKEIEAQAVEHPSDVPFSPTRRLSVFLCHSSSDKPAVRELYRRLNIDGFQPWLDEENLLPGHDWETEITKAVRAADVVIVCTSLGSITKDGFIQKEIKFALDKADEKSEGTIFIIPLKLEECEVPTRLQRWQWVNWFEERGYERLVRALQARADQLTATGSTQREKLPPRTERQQMLDLEISHRITPLPILLEECFTYTQLHTTKGSVYGKAEQHPTVGKLGEFEPLFSEFQGRSLFSLIWELQQIVAEQERRKIGSALEAAKRMPYFFDKLILLVPVGEDDSKWRMDPKFLTEYKDVLRGFDVGRWNN